MVAWMLWSAVTQASSMYLPDGLPKYLCTLPDRVLVVTVLNRTSYLQPNGKVDSVLLLAVDRTLVGPAQPYLTLWIGGGVRGPLRATDSWYPRAPIGARYVLYLSTEDDLAPPLYFQTLHDSMVLEPEPALIEAFHAACEAGEVPFVQHLTR